MGSQLKLNRDYPLRYLHTFLMANTSKNKSTCVKWQIFIGQESHLRQAIRMAIICTCGSASYENSNITVFAVCANIFIASYTVD